MNSLNFNIDNGYLEGLVRGFKAGILKQSDYANLVQCETLEGKYIGIVVSFVESGVRQRTFQAAVLLTY